MEKPTIRYRANFSVTAKGIYTPEVTVEVSNVPEEDEFELTREVIEHQLSELYDTVAKVAESKGFVSVVVEQK